MVKRLIEDIKFKKKNTIIKTLTSKDVPVAIKTNIKIPKVKYSDNYQNKSYLRALVIILLITSLIGITYWVTNIFEVTNIVIKNKHQSFSLDNKKFADIPFEVMIVSDEINKNITLTKPEEVSSKAKGAITLFNEYSTKSEKLTINSFVSDIDGKAYLIDKTVYIPGLKTVSGKIIPGSIDVGVTAFLAGESYNGSPSILNINSFKGTAKYKKIYGKIKTVLSGGIQGQVYKVDPLLDKTLNDFANSSFKENLINNIKTQVPLGYFLYPNAIQFTYTFNKSYMSKTSNTTIPISGTVSALLLKEDDVSSILMKNLFPNISKNETEEIVLNKIPELSFNFTDPNQIIKKDIKSISFTLNGEVEAVWQPDTIKLKSDLANIPKNNIQSIFKKDSGIDSAGVRLFPPWKSYLPSNPSKIRVYIE